MSITTERLTLRAWHADDAERLFDIMSRPEVMRWLGDGPTVLLEHVDEARGRIERWSALSHRPPLGYWAVELTESRRLLGAVLLLKLPNATNGEVEIGWASSGSGTTRTCTSSAPTRREFTRQARRPVACSRRNPPTRRLFTRGCLRGRP